jgi:hypothetical protein
MHKKASGKTKGYVFEFFSQKFTFNKIREFVVIIFNYNSEFESLALLSRSRNPDMILKLLRHH